MVVFKEHFIERNLARSCFAQQHECVGVRQRQGDVLGQLQLAAVLGYVLGLHARGRAIGCVAVRSGKYGVRLPQYIRFWNQHRLGDS